jgi:hypothetical protein
MTNFQTSSIFSPINIPNSFISLTPLTLFSNFHITNFSSKNPPNLPIRLTHPSKKKFIATKANRKPFKMNFLTKTQIFKTKILPFLIKSSNKLEFLSSKILLLPLKTSLPEKYHSKQNKKATRTKISSDRILSKFISKIWLKKKTFMLRY